MQIQFNYYSLKGGAIIYSTNRLIRNRIRCYIGIIWNHLSPNKLILMLKMMEYEVSYVIKPWNRRIKRSISNGQYCIWPSSQDFLLHPPSTVVALHCKFWKLAKCFPASSPLAFSRLSPLSLSSMYLGLWTVSVFFHDVLNGGGRRAGRLIILARRLSTSQLAVRQL